MNTNLETELKALVARVIKLPIDKVTAKADFYTDIKIDSLLAVEILAAIDQKYGIDIPETNIKGIRNLADLTKIVQELLDKKPK